MPWWLASKRPRRCSVPTSEQCQELILDHYRRPRNRGTLEAPDREATRANPLCGESMHVSVELDGDRVGDIRCEGNGCSISRASASMMTELVRGRSRAEISALAAGLRQVVRGQRTTETNETLGPLVALGIVSRTPGRIPCALLAWEALDEALADVVSDQ